MPSEQRGWSHLLLKLFNNPQLQDMGKRWDGNVTQLLISHNEASVQKNIVFSPSKKLKGKGEPSSKIET